ncbi:MAG: DUF1460 domain-containing protein [Ignavibacteria bacterium]|nr:DUF1460 domain-containing protein [Ignavibacteria bacterium]
MNFWNRGSSVLSLTLISLSAYSLTLNAQIYSDDDIEICNEKIQLSVDKNLAEKPISDVFIEMSESFIGTDYLAYSLETDGEEQLVVNLSGLDCTTFVEYSLALSRCIKKDTITSDDFLEELQLIRYRDGEINGYPSRLHYFSDWITNNVAKKVVEDETLQMGGKPIKFNLNFMSTHPDSYKQLIENLDLIPVIKIQEDEISSRTYYYIPKDEFESKEKFINSGDIIAITTTVDGLDIGHLGIAVRNEDGRIHLLHAPSPNTKVHITELTLADYLMKYKRHSGVIVLRVLEPTNLSH